MRLARGTRDHRPTLAFRPIFQALPGDAIAFVVLGPASTIFAM